jgi:hypothetical protein
MPPARLLPYNEGVTASVWVPLLAGTAMFFTLMVAGLMVTGFLVWRVARRKWRAVRNHGAVIGASALWEATAVRRRRGGEATTPEEVGQWTPGRARKEMWRSVDQADAALRTAADLGAPLAELPSLCRRLHAAAVDLDKVLRVEPAGPVPTEVRTQVHEVMRAAGDIQRAAVVSASDASGPRVHDLTRDAVHEIELLDAGLASAQAALPHRRH